MNQPVLHTVYQAEMMAKVLYAAAALWGFTTTDRNRITGFVRRNVRSGFCEAGLAEISTLVDESVFFCHCFLVRECFSSQMYEYVMLDEKATLAGVLRERVRVLCWVMTSPSTISSKAQHVKATWGARCNLLIFMSSEADPLLPAVGLNVSEGHDNLWGKTRAAFAYVYRHHHDDADWFLKADDDTYVIVENLRLLLSVGFIFSFSVPLSVPLSVCLAARQPARPSVRPSVSLSLSLSLSLSAFSLRFVGHFPGGPGLAGTRMSPFWITLELRVTEVL